MDKPKLYDELNVEGFINWSNARIFKDVIEIVQPKSILEIGFYRGASAFFWLYFSDARLLSVDAMRWEGCSIENIKKLHNLYARRFSFICEPSEEAKYKLANCFFDLMYIDGGHTIEIVENDIQLGVDLRVPYLFIDDISPIISKVYKKRASHEYEIIKRYRRKTSNEYISMALAKRRDIDETNLVKRVTDLQNQVEKSRKQVKLTEVIQAFQEDNMANKIFRYKFLDDPIRTFNGVPTEHWRIAFGWDDLIRKTEGRVAEVIQPPRSWIERLCRKLFPIRGFEISPTGDIVNFHLE